MGYNSAMLVTHIEASFYKKATGRITFRFNEVAEMKAAVDEAQRSTEQPATYLATTRLQRIGSKNCRSACPLEFSCPTK